MPRLFVAVYPSPSVVAALAALPRPPEPDVRWVPIDQLHVTLRFFGEADVEPAKERLAESARSWSSAHVTLGPRVSRLGRDVVCVPATGLDELAAAVADATAEIGAPPDPRPFRGHVTLARLRRRAACGLTGASFAAEFVASELTLVRSETRPEGARHTPVASFSLTG